MQSCQDLEISNREGLKMGDTFPIPRRTTPLDLLCRIILLVQVLLFLYTPVFVFKGYCMGLKMPKILWHLNNMSHKNFLRCIIAIFIARMFEGWRVVRCGFGGRS